MNSYSGKLETTLTGKDIVCVSSMPYEGMWTRKQRLMTILAEMGNRVLYVEPVEPIFGAGADAGAFSSSIKEVRKNLFVLKPPGRLPAARIGMIQRANFNSYVRAIRREVRKLKFKNPILFTYTPVIHAHSRFLDMRRYFEGSPLIYDCVDEHSETVGYTPEASRRVYEKDLELTREADLVFVTAHGLYDARKTLNQNMHLSPNGADLEHFTRAKLEDTKVPDEVLAIPGPRVGFVGALSPWIDFDLMAKIADLHPEYNLVLVGPVKAHGRDEVIHGKKNIHLLGKKKLAELPNYLKGFDCAINPFRRIGLSEKVNPLKVYEYLAAGCRVVSTDMPEIMRLEGVIYLAKDDDDFIRGVENTVNGKFVPDAEKLERVVHEHDWNKIFSDVMFQLSKLAK